MKKKTDSKRIHLNFVRLYAHLLPQSELERISVQIAKIRFPICPVCTTPEVAPKGRKK